MRGAAGAILKALATRRASLLGRRLLRDLGTHLWVLLLSLAVVQWGSSQAHGASLPSVARPMALLREGNFLGLMPPPTTEPSAILAAPLPAPPSLLPPRLGESPLATAPPSPRRAPPSNPIPAETVALLSQQTQSGEASPHAGLLARALTYQGAPYRWGATGPYAFDCSGYVYRVFQAQGIPLPRDLWGQLGSGAPVPLTELRPGDLIFFENTFERGLSHVGIYLGGGAFISAVSESKGIAVESLGRDFWRERYYGARRPALF